jgi:hypothetical protein
MEAQELKTALLAFRREELGAEAHVSAGLDLSVWGNSHNLPVTAHVYLRGVVDNVSYAVRVPTWGDLVPALRAKHTEHIAEHRHRVAREMALEIIRATAEVGECSTTRLRMKFSADEIARLGSDACAEADRMASNGPFSIAPMVGANAA